MGMQKAIRFDGREPTWPAVMAALHEMGEQPILRMIDGQPAFPDEEPADGWTELRVSVTGGMVTVRRGPGEWQCVVWGNADESLRKGWDACCEAIARAAQVSMGDTDRPE
jgi:hypothetical protein